MNRSLAAAALLAAGFVPAAGQTEMDAPVRLMLFSDATYLWTERDVHEGFSLGQVVGHLNAVLAPRLTVAVEATVTSRTAGPIATLERLILAYDVSDALRFSAGRYHTPISWWNTQFHHGLWLQTSIARPSMVRFGTPLIPVHFLGVLASGNVPVGGSTVLYEAGIGNGREPNLVGAGDAGEIGGAPAFVGGVRLRPTVVTGLELGLHGYVDQVEPGTGAAPVDERILGAHLVWLANPAIAFEYLHFRHDPDVTGAESTTSDALYLQLGYKLPTRPTLQPYVRYESVAIGAGDPLFTGLGLGYDAIIGGTRWDFSDFAALKGEARFEEFGADERRTSLVLNASFVVPNLFH